MTYINMRTSGEVETVDQFETRKEARAMLVEYSLAFNGGVYLSQRPTDDWKASQ